MMKLSLSTFAGTQYHDKGDEIFHRNKFCGSVNRLQSPSHFLQEFPRHQGHTLLTGSVIPASSSARSTTTNNTTTNNENTSTRHHQATSIKVLYFQRWIPKLYFLFGQIRGSSRLPVFSFQHRYCGRKYCQNWAWTSCYCWVTLMYTCGADRQHRSSVRLSARLTCCPAT